MNSPLMSNFGEAHREYIHTPHYLGDMDELDDPYMSVKDQRRAAREREREAKRKEDKRRRIIAEKSRRTNRGK
ncbi:MAG TPA: hypothetical protein VIG47_15570 [Gemmatimonadaceae bacterium]|jgi:hypothetical protein